MERWLQKIKMGIAKHFGSLESIKNSGQWTTVIHKLEENSKQLHVTAGVIGYKILRFPQILDL